MKRSKDFKYWYGIVDSTMYVVTWCVLLKQVYNKVAEPSTFDVYLTTICVVFLVADAIGRTVALYRRRRIIK